MNFKFSFQKVLDFKENEKVMAEQEYGSSRNMQLQLQEQMEGLEIEKEKVFHQYNNVDKKTIWEILEFQQQIDHVNRQMKQLEQKSLQVHHEVEQKHQLLMERTQEAKIWDQWKQKSKAAFEKQLEHKEQAWLDELAVLRYSRRV